MGPLGIKYVANLSSWSCSYSCVGVNCVDWDWFVVVFIFLGCCGLEVRFYVLSV